MPPELSLLADVRDPGHFGWKGYYLGRLIGAGFKVPPGLALSADFARSLNDHQAKLLFRRVQELATGRAGPLRLVVRSSATNEDSVNGSQAGSFTSIIADFADHLALGEAVREVATTIPRSMVGLVAIPVLVQLRVDPLYAGVSFAIEPTTFLDDRTVVQGVSGMADKLVSGAVRGWTVSIAHDGHVLTTDGDVPTALAVTVADLTQGVRKQLDIAADCEWCQDDSGEVFLVQARPIVLPSAADLPLANSEDFARLPPLVRGHPKLRVRRAAAESEVPMSNAVAHVRTKFEKQGSVASTSVTSDCAGTSVVLLHPERVEGGVHREFASEGTADIDLLVRSCRRYSVRRYPNTFNVGATIERVLEIGLRTSAVAVVLDAEVLSAEMTGVFRRLADGYVIELARGHFVPKGVVETSSYALDVNGIVVNSVVRTQGYALHFVDGHVVREDKPAALDVTAADLTRIVDVLRPLAPLGTLEFGCLRVGSELRPYLIDAADLDNAGDQLATGDVGAGVISAGTASGVAVMAPANVDDLDSHYYDSSRGWDGSENASGPIVLFAERDALSLLELVRRLPDGSAVVFRSASLLSHLSVVLRELGVPAIELGADEGWPTEGTVVGVDTSTRGLDRRERVVW